jgi:hypothetical protein
VFSEALETGACGEETGSMKALSRLSPARRTHDCKGIVVARSSCEHKQ